MAIQPASNQCSSALIVEQQIYEQNQSSVDAPQKPHLIHIKQTHPMNGSLIQECVKKQYGIVFPIVLLKRAFMLNEVVVKSQLGVAKAIQEHPNCPILLEGLECDWIIEEVEKGINKEQWLKVTSHFEKIFPKKELPVFDDLNDIQKETLCENSAVLILFGLQKIKAIYKSIHPEKNTTDYEQIASSESSCRALIDEKEKEVIACAKEAAIKHKHSTVLAVYGTGHNLKDICEREGFSHEEIVTTNHNLFNAEEDGAAFVKRLRPLVCIPIDVGYGNAIGFRSEPSWDTTVSFSWTPEGWVGSVPNDGELFKFVLISQDNTITWEKIDFSRDDYDSTVTDYPIGNRKLLYWEFAQKSINVSAIQF